MKTIFYFGFGILTHLVAWGSGWFGMASAALVIFWPFYILWQLVLFMGFYVLPLVVIVIAVAYIYDRVRAMRRGH